MSKQGPWLGKFTQAKFDGSVAGVTAPGVSDVLARTLTEAELRRDEAPQLPPTARVNVVLEGVITNTEVVVSVGVTDVNGITGWSSPQTQEIRSLPSATKIVPMFTFSTLRASSIAVFLESEITGGGSAKIYIVFED